MTIVVIVTIRQCTNPIAWACPRYDTAVDPIRLPLLGNPSKVRRGFLRTVVGDNVANPTF